MNKYREVMENVELTEKRQEKLLDGISAHFASESREASGRKLVRIFAPVASLALASLVLIVFVLNVPVSRNESSMPSAFDKPLGNSIAAGKPEDGNPETPNNSERPDEGTGSNSGHTTIYGGDSTVHYTVCPLEEANEIVAPGNTESLELDGKLLTIVPAESNMVMSAWWTEGDKLCVLTAEEPITIEGLKKLLQEIKEEQ